MQQIGKLPDADTAFETDFPLKEFDELLQEIELPISEQTAFALLNLSCEADESCYKVEWSLIHIVEHLDRKLLEKVLEEANEGEVKAVVKNRLENTKKNTERTS